MKKTIFLLALIVGCYCAKAQAHATDARITSRNGQTCTSTGQGHGATQGAAQAAANANRQAAERQARCSGGEGQSHQGNGSGQAHCDPANRPHCGAHGN